MPSSPVRDEPKTIPQKKTKKRKVKVEVADPAAVVYRLLGTIDRCIRDISEAEKELDRLYRLLERERGRKRWSERLEVIEKERGRITELVEKGARLIRRVRVVYSRTEQFRLLRGHDQLTRLFQAVQAALPAGPRERPKVSPPS
jgi:hypothetical protein